MNEEGGEIIIIYLQGNLIQERDITSIGKEGYYHIPVSTMGGEFSTAFVIPAEEKTEAPASGKEGSSLERG